LESGIHSLASTISKDETLSFSAVVIVISPFEIGFLRDSFGPFFGSVSFLVPFVFFCCQASIEAAFPQYVLSLTIFFSVDPNLRFSSIGLSGFHNDHAGHFFSPVLEMNYTNLNPTSIPFDIL
jgi:hypothetical protein